MLIYLKDRLPIVTIARGKVHVEDGAFTISSESGGGVIERLPVATISCIMLQPGTSISHAAVCPAAKHRCLLMWIGDAGSRVYSSGAVTHNNSKIERQVRLALMKTSRLRIARRLYQMRFGGKPPILADINELRGMEGAKTAAIYKKLASDYGIVWTGRFNHISAPDQQIDSINSALNISNACLYGLCEAGILISGYSPAIGFLHSGDSRSFVFDVADLSKIAVKPLP